MTDRPTLVHQALADWAGRTPDAPAFAHGGGILTFGALNVQADQLAVDLRRRGLSPGRRVAVCLEHGPELATAIFGILKAGGVCAPLDPGNPEARLEQLLADIQPTLTLTTRSRRALSPALRRQSCRYPEDWLLPEATPDRPGKTPSLSLEDPAFIFFTSGTTGSPKGVVHSHGGMAYSFAWFSQYFGIAPDDCGILRTSASLISFRGEVLSMVYCGARTIIVENARHHDVEHLVDLIRQHQITIIRLPPSLLRVFVNSPNLRRCLSLRHIVCGGEPLPRDLEDRVPALLPAATLHLGYGATEAPGALYRVSRPDERPAEYRVGWPTAISKVRILSPSQRPVAPGEEGEICLGGPVVALGYFSRPEQTAEHFIRDPLSDDPKDRLYRTGDRGRFLENGEVGYLGRTDLQANLRGLRIDLTEIENALARHPDLGAVAVAVREDRPGDQQLVAYLSAPVSGNRPTSKALHDFLAPCLPGSLIPDCFVYLEWLPVDPSGKVDRRSLPPPGRREDVPGRTSVLPRSATERRLAALWQELLGLTGWPGATDNLRDLGGSSLHAIRLVQAMEAAFGVPLPPSVGQRTLALAQQAELVDAALAKIATGAPEDRPVRLGALDEPTRRAILALHAADDLPWLAPDSLVIRFNPEAAGVPLYCCGAHAELARALPDHPVYGLPSGYGVVPTTDAMVEALAEHYTAEILGRNLPGPFVLVGYSFGAWIAFAMAQRLLARGHAAPLLGLIDEVIGQPYPGRAALFLAEEGLYRDLAALAAWPACSRQYSAGLTVDFFPGDHYSPLKQGAVASLIAERLESRLIGATSPGEPFPDDACRWEWQVLATPSWTAGQATPVDLALRNTSPRPWSARHTLFLGCHWYDRYDRLVRWGVRLAPIPLPLGPGRPATAPCTVVAPDVPGRYRLVFDVLDQAGDWGTSCGRKTAVVEVEVVSPGAEAGAHPPTADRWGRRVSELQQWGRLEAALEACEAGLAQHPGCPELLERAARLNLDLGRDEVAIRCARQAVALAESRSGAWKTLGLALARQGFGSEAQTAYERGLAAGLDLQEHLAFVNSLERAGLYEAAVAHWRRAASLLPGQAAPNVHLARFLWKAGQPEAALEASRQAIAASPRHPSGYILGADLLRELGRAAEGLALLAKAPVVLSGAAELERARGDCLLALGRPAEGAAAFRQGAALNPRFSLNWLKLATALADQGDLAAAKAVLEESLRHNPASAGLKAGLAALTEALGAGPRPPGTAGA